MQVTVIKDITEKAKIQKKGGGGGGVEPDVWN